MHEIRCVKLQSRYEDLYMSAHVEVRVNAADMKSALDLFMCNEVPTGVFVRHYFKPRCQLIISHCHHLTVARSRAQ